MNSFLSWIGGKKALRDVILACFPMKFEQYIEVFGGAGWVLFARRVDGRKEVFNDFNSNLTTLYRMVRENPEELIARLEFTLNSREDFNQIKQLFQEKAELDELDKAAKFYQLIRYSYASGCTSFGSQPHDIWHDFPIIRRAHRRLKDVVIENKDFEALIRQYDRESAFFYLDPPYYETEDYYLDVGFNEKDHYRLRKVANQIAGKFLLSYNDCPFVRELWQGYEMMEVSRLNNIKQRYEGGAEYKEILIANYDLDERKRVLPQQAILFE